MSIQSSPSLQNHRLEIRPPKLVVLLDPGHGGNSAAVAKARADKVLAVGEKYNIGATAAATDELPYVAEYIVTLELAKTVKRVLEFLIAAHDKLPRLPFIDESLAESIHVELTRSSDVVLSVDARRSICEDEAFRLLDKSGLIQLADVSEEQVKSHYVVFLSFHADGGNQKFYGTTIITRLGQDAHHSYYIKEMQDAIAALNDPNAKTAYKFGPVSHTTDDHTAVGSVAVLTHGAANIWSMLIETENLASKQGHLNLSSDSWKLEFSIAVALGLWEFVRHIYEKHPFVSDPHLIDTCADVVEKMIVPDYPTLLRLLSNY